MKNFQKIIFVIAAASLILACGIASAPATTAPDQQNISTVVAGTIQAITAATPTTAPAETAAPAATSPAAATTAPTQSAPQGTKVSFENISLVIPISLGSGANTITNDDVEMPPFVNPSNGPMPQHIVITINGYPLPREAKIAIFKASDYASYADSTNLTISALQSLNFQAGGEVPSDLGSTFMAEAAPVAIQNGHGLRYVTQIMEAAVPISNDQTYYYYQGMTNDKAYFVMAVLPVSASFLAPTGGSDAVLPSDGIQFPPFSNPNATNNDINGYYDAVTQKMNTATPTNFTPSIADLDVLIQSITITP